VEEATTSYRILVQTSKEETNWETPEDGGITFKLEKVSDG
jgi:hypothetical protein